MIFHMICTQKSSLQNFHVHQKNQQNHGTPDDCAKLPSVHKNQMISTTIIQNRCREQVPYIFFPCFFSHQKLDRTWSKPGNQGGLDIGVRAHDLIGRLGVRLAFALLVDLLHASSGRHRLQRQHADASSERLEYQKCSTCYGPSIMYRFPGKPSDVFSAPKSSGFQWATKPGWWFETLWKILVNLDGYCKYMGK